MLKTYTLLLSLIQPWLILRRKRVSYHLESFKRDPSKTLLWFHAISVGETKALASLIKLIKKNHPDYQIVISHVTKTGLEESKRSLPNLEAHFILPLDLKKVTKRLIEELSPTLFIQSETDFWPHLLHLLKKKKIQTILINGKMSDKTFSIYQKLPWVAKNLLKPFDKILVQTESYAKRFQQFTPVIPKVTQNLKLDLELNILSPHEKNRLKEKLHLTKRVIILASTHEGEEEMLLQALKDTPCQILLVPRHKERFKKVERLLENYDYATFTKPASASIILVNQMGILTDLYQVSDAAIVAGSFCSKIGGHNIFEPISLGLPTLFGPYMHSQREMERLALEASAGASVILDELPLILNDLKRLENLSKNARKLCEKKKGSLIKTYHEIRLSINTPCS
ncbi:MAG: glycosyltransferase N-terminal domain-containing protein [Simkaniaceae bacterium]